MCAARFNRLPDTVDVVGSEVVHPHRLSRPQLWNQHVADEDEEGLSVDRAFELKSGGNSVLADGLDDRDVGPVVHRALAVGSLAPGRTGVTAGHVSCDAALIQKQMRRGVQLLLERFVRDTLGRDVGPILLGGFERFFYD